MTKYMEPLLKIVILCMTGVVILRIRYIWSMLKQESQFTFRNREGDLSIIIFFLLVMNKSRFQRYQLSYQPLLRYLYAIIVGLFLAYCMLQVTQIIKLTKQTLISPQGIIENEAIDKCTMQKHMVGYKIMVYYMKKGKETCLTLMVSGKNKDILEKMLKERNVNIV